MYKRQWLAEELRKPAELRVLGSSIQVLPAVHPAEKWANMPLERTRLLELIDNAESGAVVVLSGDQHLGEVSLEKRPAGYTLVEVTSSGMTHARGLLPAPNQFRIGKPAVAHNFGTLKIDWNAPIPTLTVAIRNVEGTAVIDRTFRIEELSPPATRTGG